MNFWRSALAASCLGMVLAGPTAPPAQGKSDGGPYASPRMSRGVTGLPSVSAAPPLDDSTVITIERGICHWKCPDYSLALYGSGRVEFEGRRNVCERGRHSANVDPAAVRVLVASVVAAGYFYLWWNEGPLATGAITVTTSLRHHGGTRTIRHYHGDSGAPLVLTEIEERIDQVAGTARWLPERKDHQRVCHRKDGTIETLEN